jgi:hypothetical protein
MTLILKRLTRQCFETLWDQWAPLLDESELFREHAEPQLQHARNIVSEDPLDPRYGIYGLVRDGGDGPVYEAFTHVNHKLAGSPHAEVRLVWNTLSPRYETELDPDVLAEFTYAFITGAIRLAQSELKADSVRVYLGNATDRQYARGIVDGLRAHPIGSVTVALAGNWMHISGVTGLSL